ncbi:uncharacterized protein LOC126793909 [Argentina anserina]|uniref:uncharacterized protein LOC126793909 n=1 Tax=Argentina anserina TaxID=57926 RepID=UPI0021764AC4|nr:uncharacterized protein LOC126793909 [Potentilla anserina]
MAIPAASALAKPKPKITATSSSTTSRFRAYSMPLILFLAAMYFQLSVIPKSFPPSHYDVLGLRESSIEEVKAAYDNVSSTWNEEAQAPDSLEFIEVRYAYELLTNPSWKRNYDIFGFEEQIDVIEKLKKQYAGESFSLIDLPLLESAASGKSHFLLKNRGASSPIRTPRPFNNSHLLNIIEQNKEQELPQLRSTTSMQLGCDAHGFSRAGFDTVTWYCAVIAGRHSLQLSEMRRTMCRVQDTLSNEVESADEEPDTAPAAHALKSKRLTFAWLDGEVQKKYCLFFLQSETSYETCGSRTDMTDVTKLFIIRYKRNVTEESDKPEGKPKSIWDSLQDQELDPAAQLVAKYNGSHEIPERTRTPQLVPDDSEPIWSGSVQRIPSPNTIKQSITGILRGVHDHMEDPRIGPILLLAALMSFGSIWLRRSQATPLSNQPNSKDRTRRRKRDHSGAASTRDLLPSITDLEPRDSYEMPQSVSDSDQ